MNYKAIVIGASAGGLTALQEILTPLPANFRLPILVVQHRFPTADDLLTFALNESCRLTVKEADEKDYIEPGYVYVARPITTCLSSGIELYPCLPMLKFVTPAPRLMCCLNQPPMFSSPI